MDVRERRLFFRRLKRRIPAPTTELDYSSEFELLVSVILSAQATDLSVNKATRGLFQVASTPEAIIGLGENRLKDHIKAIGLFNTKARNIVKTCRILVAEFGSQVPRERASLESLPGVGRKTANVILNTAFGEPTIAVDTHIFRVSNRTGLAPGKTPLAVERVLLEVVPDRYKKDAHHWLILHGRYTCVARKPKCDDCCVFDLCAWDEKKGHANGR
ncbi:MAG TPA: endonuclease III [Gammaproteobacteria bacterium]|nr:endonuclease III [Gammaproteobacteria bacterium]